MLVRLLTNYSNEILNKMTVPNTVTIWAITFHKLNGSPKFFKGVKPNLNKMETETKMK